MTILRNQSQRVHALRKSMGMSQSDLAHAMHVPQSTVSRWERTGNMRQVSMAALEELQKRHEAQQLHVLPSLRLASAELALAVLEGEGNQADYEAKALKVLTIMQGEK